MTHRPLAFTRSNFAFLNSLRGPERVTFSGIWTTYLRFRFVSDSKTRCFKKEYFTFTRQLLLDWGYNFKHHNFRKQTTMFVREKHLWKRNLCFSVVDLACGFPVKAFAARVIGHTWKTDHIVPWQVLINLKQSTYYSIKLRKTPDCCEIMTAQFKIRRKTYFLPGTARRAAMSWYSFHSVNHTWKS